MLHAMQPSPRRTVGQRALVVLWPAFVAAGVLEMLVFASVDPGDITVFASTVLAGSRTAVYCVAFLIFWGVIGAAAAVSAWLEAPPHG